MSSPLPRRRFLTVLGFGLPAGSLAVDEKEDDADQPVEWETEDKLEGIFHEEAGDGGDPNVTLRVRIERLNYDEIIEAADGSRTWRGEKVSAYSHTVIRAFSLEWDGKTIRIPKRFWEDLGGLEIQELKSPRPFGDGTVARSWDQAADWLRRPRVFLSEDGGTILIEWIRSLEGDLSWTVRWIVSKAGTVLRHRVSNGELF